MEVSYQGTKASSPGISRIKLLPFSFCQIPALAMLIWPSEMYFQLNHQGLEFRVFEVTCGKWPADSLKKLRKLSNSSPTKDRTLAAATLQQACTACPVRERTLHSSTKQHCHLSLIGDLIWDPILHPSFIPSQPK